MEENYSYYYDTEQGIMYKSYFGEITLQNIEASWEEAFRKDIIPKNTKKFILDYRKASIKMKSQKHEGISSFYKNHPEVFQNAKIAVVTNNPKDVVISILVHKKDDSYDSLPFSTLEAAKEWVLN